MPNKDKKPAPTIKPSKEEKFREHKPKPDGDKSERSGSISIPKK